MNKITRFDIPVNWFGGLAHAELVVGEEGSHDLSFDANNKHKYILSLADGRELHGDLSTIKSLKSQLDANVFEWVLAVLNINPDSYIPFDNIEHWQMLSVGENNYCVGMDARNGIFRLRRPQIHSFARFEDLDLNVKFFEGIVPTLYWRIRENIHDAIGDKSCSLVNFKIGCFSFSMDIDIYDETFVLVQPQYTKIYDCRAFSKADVIGRFSSSIVDPLLTVLATNGINPKIV